jgi:hypothetical protein
VIWGAQVPGKKLNQDISIENMNFLKKILENAWFNFEKSLRKLEKKFIKYLYQDFLKKNSCFQLKSPGIDFCLAWFLRPPVI